MSAKTLTVHEALLQASSFLNENGVQDSRSVAELLILHVLDWDKTTLFLEWKNPFPEAKCTQWQQILRRKAAGEPAQYITGEQEFYGLPFLVSPAVLIPRPETEILVEQVIALGKQLWPDHELHRRPLAADIGTGSGAISVCLAVHCPSWRIAASDISFDALEIARINAGHHKVADKISWHQGDLLEPFILGKTAIDILVANPPYIETAVIETLQPEVRSYEPMNALDGGVDGLFFYRKIISQLVELTEYPRLVAFEAGQGQASQIAEMLLHCHQWDQIKIIPDYAGIDRHVAGWRY